MYKVHIQLRVAERSNLRFSRWSPKRKHRVRHEWSITQTIYNIVAKDMMLTSRAADLAEKFNEVVESWGLTGGVIACVRDNAQNIVSASFPSRTNWALVQCLQLAINDRFADHLKPVIEVGLTVNTAHS